MNNDYRSSYREAEREYFWTFPRATVALFALVIFLGAGAWGISLLSQPGRIVSKTFDADHVISSYEWFHDAHGNFKAKTSQVAQFKKLRDEEKDEAEKRRLRTDMAAIQQSCRDLANRYNANSTKSNKSIFKGREAPETLNAENCE